MKITYDKKADAAYIKLNDQAVYQMSKKVTDDVIIDYAQDGTVVGIEVLDASSNTSLAIGPTQIAIQGL